MLILYPLEVPNDKISVLANRQSSSNATFILKIIRTISSSILGSFYLKKLGLLSLQSLINVSKTLFQNTFIIFEQLVLCMTQNCPGQQNLHNWTNFRILTFLLAYQVKNLMKQLSRNFGNKNPQIVHFIQKFQFLAIFEVTHVCALIYECVLLAKFSTSGPHSNGPKI